MEKNLEKEEKTVWIGFKFIMGVFVAWSEDGRVAMGKCDPVTAELFESYILNKIPENQKKFKNCDK